MNNLINSLSLLYNWILKLNLVNQAEYVHVMHSYFWCVAEESIRSVYAFVSDMKEKMSKLQYQKQLLLHRVSEKKLQVEFKHSAYVYLCIYMYMCIYIHIYMCTYIHFSEQHMSCYHGKPWSEVKYRMYITWWVWNIQNIGIKRAHKCYWRHRKHKGIWGKA